MGNLKQLARRLNTQAERLNKRANNLSVEVALTIINSLVRDTPVDTSRALSNWQIGLGSPNRSKIEPHYPGERGSTFGSSSQAAITAARAALSRKTPEQTIYISNSLPYIRRLNAGYSKQSPGAFVEAAVVRGREYLRKQRRKGR